MEFSQHSVQSAAPAIASAVDNFDTRFFSTKKISMILDDDNFLLWRQQVLLAIKTYKLQQFLDSRTIPPPATLPDADGILQENPEFSRFEQQDSALASWLLSSILHFQRKGDLSMKDFLMKIKGFCDNLASCGEVITEREHVTAILNGLPPEYDSVITIITASYTPYTVQGPPGSNINSDSPPAYRPTTVSRGRSHGRSSGSRIQCQLCGKMGHLVDRCYHCFDSSYKNTGYRPPYSQTNVCMFGQGAPFSPWLPSPPPGWFIPPTSPMSWNANTPQSGSTLTYPDSGATHHLTYSATAIGESTPYNGPGKIYVGNGSTLPVHSTVSQFTKDNHVVFEFLPTQCQVRDLHTKEVLLRGSVHHGLYRLQLKDNFQLRHCSAHGLTASVSVPVSLWHARLGHPCTSTLTKALSHCNVPFVSNKDSFDCVACHLGKERNLPFSHSASKYVNPLGLVVADVWGPAPISSNGFRYYMAFTDAGTRYTWVYFMRQKSEVSTIFPSFFEW
ncbi:hypothetical protein CXB51_016084 [Gossypium anomalum]|uniref:GAG-pre-integrase domain-containing protein n=1 Tax=Gossypium anomalum TaxID=47600 RepID=A0A8J5YPT4_9ROSI|nr:hypothetical protein CXB51_016084 [Gossypium anomalum]